ncbi:MAG: chromate transporter [Spirochaetaceae bacterium]|jgi:chromate transporter|nr:chromate transporter [Spirochaetaceae bacterium]
MMEMIVAHLVLFAEFFKIGLFAIGGGLATLPFLYELAGNYPLQALSAERIPDMLTVAQLVPGAMGLNLAGYIGMLVSVPAAYIAVLGILTPQITVMTLVIRMYDSFKANKIVRRIFLGLTPAAAALLGAAGFRIWRLALYNSEARQWFEFVQPLPALIFIIAFIVIRKAKKVPLVLLFACAGIVGIILGL